MTNSHTSSLSVSAWIIALALVMAMLLGFIFVTTQLNNILDESLDTARGKNGRKRFVLGVMKILNDFEDDNEAVREIRMLYDSTIRNYSVLRKENYTSAWDLINYLVWTNDTMTETQLRKQFGLEDVSAVRKRLSIIRDLLREEFRFPYVEGEQAHLFKALGTSIKEKDLDTASEVLSDLADVLRRNKEIQQKRDKRSFWWTVTGTITGIIGLVMTIISFVK